MQPRARTVLLGNGTQQTSVDGCAAAPKTGRGSCRWGERDLLGLLRFVWWEQQQQWWGEGATLFLKRAAFLDTPSPRHGMLWVDVQQGGGRVVKGSGLPLLMFVFLFGAIEEEVRITFWLGTSFFLLRSLWSVQRVLLLAVPNRCAWAPPYLPRSSWLQSAELIPYPPSHPINA